MTTRSAPAILGATAFLALGLVSSHPAAADGLQGDIAFSRGDYAKAYQEWSAAARSGDSSAMAAIGTLYDTGHGVPQDFTDALHWYRRAAEAGNPRAMFNVAAMYDNGRGTPIDRAAAVRWYALAAQKGNGRAAYNLGVIYNGGDGVARDTAKAIKYFQLASSAGIRAARPNLLALNAPVPTDKSINLEVVAPLPVPQSSTTSSAVGASLGASPAPALSVTASSAPASLAPLQGFSMGTFHQAALARVDPGPDAARSARPLIPILSDQAGKGDGQAQYDVGYAYEYGVGVTPDPVKSYVYYLRASASSESAVREAALKGAASVGAHLTAEQHAAARDRLLEQ